MKKYFLIFISIFLMLIIVEQGCGTKKDEIKIGAIFSMTGNVAEYGQRSRKGFELAVEIINQRGGIRGKKIVPLIEDAKSDPKFAIAAFNKLVKLNKVNIIVGDVLSSTTLALVPLLEKNKVILFAPGASHPDLRCSSPYFFRNWVSDDFDGFAMANYMFKNNITEVGVFVQKSDYTLGLVKAFEKEFIRLGGKLLIREEFDTDQLDFRTTLLKFKAKNIDTVYLVGEAKENGRILKQAFELNYYPHWFANLTVETPECKNIAGKALDGVIFSTPAFSIHSDRKEVKEFVNKFRLKYSETPEVTSAHAYDAMFIIARAIENVGFDIDKIRKEILNTKDFPGVSGITTFDSCGDVKKDIFIKKIVNGESVLIKDFLF